MFLKNRKIEKTRAGWRDAGPWQRRRMEERRPMADLLGPGERGRKKRGDERWKKIGVFWSLNFKKHSEWVSSGTFRRVVKL